MSYDLLPHGESLRRAVAWMSELRVHDCKAVEEACQRFDLSPLEEEFLLAYFIIDPCPGKDKRPRG
jgi:hypothetical protein